MVAPPTSCTDKASVLITSLHLYLSHTPLLPPSLHPLRHFAVTEICVTACRHAACLAGGGASPGQTEGAGGGTHRGEAQPAQVGAPEPPLSPDPGLAEVRPASQRPGTLKSISQRHQINITSPIHEAQLGLVLN